MPVELFAAPGVVEGKCRGETSLHIDHRLEILSKALRQIREITALPSLDPHFGIVERIASDAIEAADTLQPAVVGSPSHLDSGGRIISPSRQPVRYRGAHARKAKQRSSAKEPARR